MTEAKKQQLFTVLNTALQNNKSASIGLNAKAKGVTGSWIVLAEWKEITWNEREIVCVKSALVDGVTIKANTYYKLINGEFTEA